MTNPTSKVPVFLSIDELAIIAKCGKNFAYKIADHIIEENPGKVFKGKRIPSNLLVQHLGITMEQAEQRLLLSESKSKSL